MFYLLLMLLMSTVILSAGDKHQMNGAKMFYSKPSAIVMDAFRYLGKLHQFSLDAVTSNDDVFRNKMLVTYTHWVHIDLQRPGKLHVSVDGDLKERSFYLNDGRFVIYDKVLGYYGKLKLPVSVDAALDDLFEQYDIKTALANVLYSDLYKRIPPKQEGYYFGLSNVDDIVCHHIGFSNKVQEIQYWIEKGKRPLIRKFIVIDKTEALLPRSSTVLRWDITPDFNDEVFEFTPPKNAVEIPIEPDTAREKRS
ncbi:hypothetical protein MNB_SV-10-923 [hydrothermal vent metagenome]|uniref:DUF2092 domain-containing protein n=1 Tax=hydrothermal vent metagenome TaxID=652676 RepID=A0A1W1BKD0_9ZZZZ